MILGFYDSKSLVFICTIGVALLNTTLYIYLNYFFFYFRAFTQFSNTVLDSKPVSKELTTHKTFLFSTDFNI